VAGLALAAERTNAGCGAGIDCGIVPIAFDAEHKCAGLEIHTQRTADHAAIIAASAGCSWEAWHRLRNGVEATTADAICREFGIAPAPAAIDADIEAGPVVDREHRRNVDRRCARRRRWRQIGGQS